jgi:ferritin
MISKKLQTMLTEQVGHELAASQYYMGMAIYFGLENNDTWANIFKVQSEEERGHAKKIVDFLVDTDTKFDIPAIPLGTTKFASGLEVVEKALANEQQVTTQFHAMAETALSEKDFTSFQFLQWFIEEQVEEESTMDRYITIWKGETNPVRAEMIVAELSEHSSGGE